MKIAICIKHVPVSEEVEIDPVTHSVRRADATYDMNPCDWNAMEMAAEFKKATNGTIAVYTMGPDGAAASLKKCLALGADEAYLLSDRKFAGRDTLGTARVLADFVKRGAYDIVFTGAESSDGATGQVGAMLAEFLGMPDVADAVSVKQDTDGTLVIGKKLQQGILNLKSKGPVLLSVPFGCNEPKLPTLRAQMKANHKEIHVFTGSDCSTSVLENLEVKSIVTDVYPAPEADKQAEEITGTPQEIAVKIQALLEGSEKDV